MSGEAAELPVFWSHLPAAWSKFVDVNLVVIPDFTAPFGLVVTFAEVREEVGKRRERTSRDGLMCGILVSIYKKAWTSETRCIDSAYRKVESLL